jgi:phosphoserine phosphatase RsbU/P
MAKILIVDDEPDLEYLIRQKFRKNIRENEFEFLAALNGVDALNILQNDQQIDLVLTDINMPQMDGLTLFEEIRKLNKPLLKSIIISAYGDMENIRTAMNRGAFDFITKPINFDDLETTIKKTLDEVSMLEKALKSQNEFIALQKELTIARNIQLSILPKTYPIGSSGNGLEIDATIETANEVGGDFYDYFNIDDERIGFLIGDVSGKGVPAAIFMAVCKTILKATALQGLPANECLSVVNNILVGESLSNVFVTVFYGILNSKTGELEFCNAGHNAPFFIDSNSSVKMLEEVDGIPLGFIQNYHYSKQNMRLKDGDTIFLYTDGVTEAMDQHENEFSNKNLEKTLEQYVSRSLSELNKCVMQEVKNYVNGFAQSDDITLFSLRYSET